MEIPVNPEIEVQPPSHVYRPEQTSSMSIQSPSTDPSHLNNTYAKNTGESPPPRPIHFDHRINTDPLVALNQRELRLRKLNPPPKFEPRQLYAWVRNIRYWRDLYSTVDEQQILSPIGLSATEELREILMDYFEESKAVPLSRTLGDF